jgi:hypothetical protein
MPGLVWLARGIPKYLHDLAYKNAIIADEISSF